MAPSPRGGHATASILSFLRTPPAPPPPPPPPPPRRGAVVRVIPLTLKQANELIVRWHRHHKPVVGHRFSLGLLDGDELKGAAIVGRPVSREIPQYEVAEVTRLVTDGTKN